MKNWIKILTLAGFVFFGTMIHSSAFADYVQGQANTWLENPEWYYVNISHSAIHNLGSFSSIDSLTLTIDNTWSDTQYAGVFLQIQGDEWWISECYTFSPSTAIPVGISDVTFYFTGCQHSNTEIIATGYPIRFGIATNSDVHDIHGYGGRDYIKIAAYSGSCLTEGITTGMYGNECPPNIKFAINTGFAPPYSFTAPTNTNVAYYTPITFSGTCAVEGANKLSLTFGRNDGSIDNYTAYNSSGTFINEYTGTYDIACNSGTWTKTIGVSPSVVAAILVNNPGTTTYTDAAMLGLYVTADGRAPNFLSFDDVMTHSPEINDFNQWLLDFSADPSGTATSTKICAYYGLQASSTYLSFDCSYNFDPHTATYPNTVQFPKETPLPMGNYKAVGSWIDNNNPGVDIATTTEWDFSVVYSTSTKPATTFPNGGIPASTANGNSENNTLGNPNCNQGNIIVSGICSVAVYLLMPKNSDLTQFNGLFNNIKNKPPFGYFTAAQLAISGLATSTPAIMLAGISLLGVFFSPIRIGFTLLIYFLAGLFIFNRLRHFNFQS